MSRKEKVVTINIQRKKDEDDEDDDEENDDELQDAYEFAKKYDVELDDEIDDIGISGSNKDSPSKNTRENKEEFDMGIQINMAKKTEAFILKIDEKNKEIEKLCTLLEAIEPVPKLNPDKFMSILDGTADGALVDYRDSKIVQLAKKCRRLTLALNKERGNNGSKGKELETLQSRCEKLQLELDMVSSSSARAAATKGLLRDNNNSSKESNNNDNETKDLKREMASQAKQIEEWKRKLTASQEELKKLQRVLTKELGEGVSLDQAVDEGWRGRAQQIVMLKAKIRRLESGTTTGTTGSAATTGTTSVASSNKSRNKVDVDSKAEDELADMSHDRQQAVEALTEDYSRLSEENEAIKKKSEAQKARIRNLETDGAKLKTQLKVLVEKATSDEELVDALRSEINKIRAQVQADKQARETAAAAAAAGPRVVRMTGASNNPSSTSSNDTSSLESEVTRLRRLCAQQAQQLETQDKVIKQLRGKS